MIYKSNIKTRYGGKDMDCIFCKLANGEIPTNMVYEDDKVAAFRDMSPVTPVHILVVPKKHYTRGYSIGRNGYYRRYS